jgi:hypothetical protein
MAGKYMKPENERSFSKLQDCWGPRALTLEDEKGYQEQMICI